MVNSPKVNKESNFHANLLVKASESFQKYICDKDLGLSFHMFIEGDPSTIADFQGALYV